MTWIKARRMRNKRKYTADRREDASMSQAHDENEPIPFMQRLLDNPFLLLFIGVLFPTVLYILWGVIDILTIPLAK
ncbi:MAG: hypothetical protein KIS84_03315 [Dokdonella sp.]|nr:hypothetical protein [Dokdonella sp.]